MLCSQWAFNIFFWIDWLPNWQYKQMRQVLLFPFLSAQKSLWLLLNECSISDGAGAWDISRPWLSSPPTPNSDLPSAAGHTPPTCAQDGADLSSVKFLYCQMKQSAAFCGARCREENSGQIAREHAIPGLSCSVNHGLSSQQEMHIYTYPCLIRLFRTAHIYSASPGCQLGFPGGSDGKESPCNAGDAGSIPGLGRSPGEGHGSPLQCSCLENSLDRGAWLAAVHGLAKSQTWLSQVLG